MRVGIFLEALSRPLENDEDMLEHMHEEKVEETMSIMFSLSESASLKSLIPRRQNYSSKYCSASDLRDALLNEPNTMLLTSFYFLFMYMI